MEERLVILSRLVAEVPPVTCDELQRESDLLPSLEMDHKPHVPTGDHQDARQELGIPWRHTLMRSHTFKIMQPLPVIRACFLQMSDLSLCSSF